MLTTSVSWYENLEKKSLFYLNVNFVHINSQDLEERERKIHECEIEGENKV